MSEAFVNEFPAGAPRLLWDCLVRRGRLADTVADMQSGGDLDPDAMDDDGESGTDTEARASADGEDGGG